MTVKEIWEGYKNGVAGAVLRLVITILLPTVGFLCFQLSSDIRQRFFEIGQDISFLRQNIVVKSEFFAFKKEVRDNLKICNDHIAKDEFIWEIESKSKKS